MAMSSCTITPRAQLGSALFLGALLALLALPAQAQVARPGVPPDGSVSGSAPSTACSFATAQLPPEAVVLAAGHYAGRTLDYQIDRKSNQAATGYDVLVHHPSAPVVLMLGSHQAGVWTVRWTEGTHIAAVWLSGYHRQVLFGLPASTPVLSSFHDQPGPCGWPDFHVNEQELVGLNRVARSTLGRPITRVYRAVDGAVRIGTAPADARIRTVDASPKDLAAIRSPHAPGQAGLDAAVARGDLRLTRLEDWVNWGAATRSCQADVPPVNPGPPRTTDAGLPRPSYVVLRRFNYPAGLYGLQATTFIIPAGVPTPDGDPGHSNVHDHNRLPARNCP